MLCIYMYDMYTISCVYIYIYCMFLLQHVVFVESTNFRKSWSPRLELCNAIVKSCSRLTGVKL